MKCRNLERKKIWKSMTIREYNHILPKRNPNRILKNMELMKKENEKKKKKKLNKEKLRKKL